MKNSFVGEKGWSGNFAKKFANQVVASKYAILLLSALFVVAGGWGIKRLALSNDYRVWFSPDSEDLKAFELLETKYSKSDSILFVVAPQDGEVFTQKTLSDIKWLTEMAWKTPYSSRVDSLTNFQKTDAKKDELLVHDLVKNPEKLSSEDLKKVKAYALKEPALVKSLVSATGHVAAVNITINMPGKSATESSEIAAYVRGLKKKLIERDPNIKAYLTGVIMLEVVDAEISQQDMQTLIPLMYVLLLIGLGLLLRSFVGTFVTLLTITFTIIASMGISGWLGYPITAISSMVPTIIMTLAVSDCVHLLVTYFQRLRHGDDKAEAMKTAICFNFYPSSITSLANVVGYASMNFSESPPFRQFGTTVAIGSALELVLAFAFIPALMLVLPVGKKFLKGAVAGTTSDDARPSRLEASLASIVLRNRYRFLGALTAITLVFGYFALQNERNEEYIKYHAMRIELRQDNEFIAKNLTGLMDLEYALDAKKPEGIFEPSFLTQVEAFATWLRQQPEVESVSPITDVVKRINQSMHGDDPAYYRIPDDRKSLAQNLLLYEMSLPYGMDLTNFFNLDKSGTRVLVRVKKITTNELMALDRRAKAWASAHTKLFNQDQSYSASVSMLFAKINDRMIEGMVKGFLLSFVLISALLMLLFRSFKVGLLSIVPNMFPAVIAFGIWGLTNGMIGMAVAMVCSTTLGVVVDSTIHLFYHYLDGRRARGFAPEQAVHHAFQRAGTAIVVTDSILIIGFCTLILSPFELNWVMGEMTAMTIFFDIFVTLFLTVPFILLFDRPRNNRGGSMLERLMANVKTIKKSSFRKAGKTALPALALTTVGLLVGTNAIANPAEKGLEIAKKAKKAEAGYHDYSARIKMTLVDAGGEKAAPNLLRIAFFEPANDADMCLATFDAPGDVKGTSLLTHSHRASEDDQWLYLPSLKRVKRISSTNKSGPFMGSEFAYEDMNYEPVEHYKYKFIKQESCNLGSCFVVERTPVNPESGYSKQLVWWDTKFFRVAKVEYFDRKGTALKTLEDANFKQFVGRIWRPMTMTMTNQQTGRKTIIEWSDLKYHSGLAAGDFNVKSLERPR